MTDFKRSLSSWDKKLTTVLFRFILAVGLAMTLSAKSAAEEKPSDLPQDGQAPAPAQTVDAGAASQGRPREWFGSELPWQDWSGATGDWGGWRTQLKETGINIEGSQVVDWSRVASGGIRRRSTMRGLLDLRATFELNSLLGVDAGTVSAQFYTVGGRHASRDAGDIQSFSNIDSERRRHQLAELWYEKKFLNEIFRLKLGKVDANTEFAFVENGGEFINSSMGFSPTIFTLPTYPDPATSINLFVYPTEKLYVGFGAYDGAGQRGYETGSRGPRTFFDGLNRLFYIGELGGKWMIPGIELPGRVGIGGWHHHGSFERFDGRRKSGSAGLYLVLDQTIWRVPSAGEDKPKGIGMFFQYGLADGAVSEIKRHLGGGFVWTGMISGRDEDALGWGITWVRFSGAIDAGFDKKYELATETFYKFQITAWASIKPNLQYIVNPSGVKGVKNAFVPTMRFEWTF